MVKSPSHTRHLTTLTSPLYHKGAEWGEFRAKAGVMGFVDLDVEAADAELIKDWETMPVNVSLLPPMEAVALPFGVTHLKPGEQPRDGEGRYRIVKGWKQVEGQLRPYYSAPSK